VINLKTAKAETASFSRALFDPDHGGQPKDWRRIHTRYDRCAHTFMSAICIAAVVIFWL
jgi:transposase